LIIDFVKTRFKSKPFLKMVIIGLIVVPSLVIMAIQASMLYGKPVESGGSGIAIIWGRSLFTQGFATLFQLGCGIGFPCLVAIANFKNLKRFEKFNYVMFAVQFIISIMFTETGRRQGHGNFAWGVYGAAFFLFIIAFSRFADDLKDYKNKSKLYLILGSILALAHIASSVYYLIHMAVGGAYAA
ncbi:MAG: hypothetical protein IKY44_03790, partial [Clostridia bacterium]|nr:hypothetical protein [Clostridia bacterium]